MPGFFKLHASFVGGVLLGLVGCARGHLEASGSRHGERSFDVDEWLDWHQGPGNVPRWKDVPLVEITLPDPVGVPATRTFFLEVNEDRLPMPNAGTADWTDVLPSEAVDAEILVLAIHPDAATDELAPVFGMLEFASPRVVVALELEGAFEEQPPVTDAMRERVIQLRSLQRRELFEAWGRGGERCAPAQEVARHLFDGGGVWDSRHRMTAVVEECRGADRDEVLALFSATWSKTIPDAGPLQAFTTVPLPRGARLPAAERWGDVAHAWLGIEPSPR